MLMHLLHIFLCPLYECVCFAKGFELSTKRLLSYDISNLLCHVLNFVILMQIETILMEIWFWARF